MVRRLIGLSLLVLNAMSSASAQPSGATTQGAAAPDMRAIMEAQSRIPDTHGTGPYPAIKEVDPRFPGHVVYRPRDLRALGSRKLGVFLWGNGGCSDDAASARLYLAEIASHGYLVVVPGAIKSGPGVRFRYEPMAPPPPGKVIPPVKTTAQDVRRGLDLAMAADADAGSPYFHRIDPNRVAVSGHSCGGLQALQVAGDPRVKAVIIHNSGIFADGSNPIAGLEVDKGLLAKLHTPILYVLGGKTDVAYPNGMDDFAKIDTVPAVVVNLPTGHGGTFMEPNGGMGAKVALAWLDWQLGRDAAAKRMFVGADCELCARTGVTVQRKRID